MGYGAGSAQGTAAEGARSAESTRRPGCGGRFDQVTGIGSPAHRLVKLEVRLGMGDRIDKREVQSNPAGSRMSASGRLLPVTGHWRMTGLSQERSFLAEVPNDRFIRIPDVG
jgi:hypothetical protein